MISDSSKRMHALSAAAGCGKRTGKEQQETAQIKAPAQVVCGGDIPFGQRRGRRQKHPLRGVKGDETQALAFTKASVVGLLLS